MITMRFIVIEKGKDGMKANGAKKSHIIPPPLVSPKASQGPSRPVASNGGTKGGIMTLREVAQYLGLHVMTVYKLTREGRVPAAKIGGQWRFKRDVLDEWLEMQMRRNPSIKAS